MPGSRWWQCGVIVGLLGAAACGGAEGNACDNAGAEGCACTPLGRCQAGLDCLAGLCIDPAAGVSTVQPSSASTVDPGETGETGGTTGDPTDSSDSNGSATATTATSATTATTATTEPPAVCGDGNVDPGEVCDDGNEVDDDACGNDCAPPSGPVLEFVDPVATIVLGTKSGSTFGDSCKGPLRGIGGFEVQDQFINQVFGDCAIATLVPAAGGHEIELTKGAALPAHGVASGTAIDSTCPAGKVVVGFSAFEDGLGLSGLQLFCASLSVWPDTLEPIIGLEEPLPLVGGLGTGGLGQAYCPENFVAIGILGFIEGQGDSLIAFGLQCARPVAK